MEYTVIVNGKSYDLPKKTIAVAESLEEVLKVDSTNLKIRQKMEKLHRFSKDLLGEDNVKEILGTDDLEEADEWLEELAYWIDDLTYYYSLPELDKNRQVTGVSITGSPYPMEANDKEAMYQILVSITYTRERREL